MTDEARIQQLLDELLDSDRTPEEVCASCPELLPVVRNRWRKMRRLRADLDALFPPPGGTVPQAPDGTALPTVPGYEVEAVLGYGGMGVVFRARHLRLNRPVALKMMLAGGYAGPGELARFLREAEAVAGLRHPNVVQVYDVGDAAGRPYFTMELVEGGSLAAKVAGAPQPAAWAAALVATLAEAIQAAHQRGIVHRDLKPGNILLTADGAPKVTDFGLARRLEGDGGLTLSGAPLGTPSYMAPEQARGDRGAIGPATDVYALGAILYECLTGRPPFRAETAAATLQQVVADEPVPPARLNPRVPRDLETICLKCLQKTPARRYASAWDLAEDLHRFQDGKPVHARPVGAAERAVKWVRRRPAAALLLAALLLTSVAAAGTRVWLSQQAADRRATQERRQGQARQTIDTALRRADDLQREERWREALDVLADASPHLAEANSPSLEERFRNAQSGLRIAADLEAARESYPILPDGMIDQRQRASDYRQAFARLGVRIDGDEEEVAASLRDSAHREQLAAAVEDFAHVDSPSRKRLLTIARLADPGSSWRDRFRDPDVWGSGAQLQELAASAFSSSPPPSENELALLGMLLAEAGARGRGIELLAEACRRQPRNFWVHREMGYALHAEGRHQEAAGYFRVAVSLRPNNAGALEGLGWALFNVGRPDDACAVFRQAIQSSPRTTSARAFLVQMLADAGRWNEAEAECRRALELDPTNSQPSYTFGEVLYRHGRNEEALLMGRKAVEADPDNYNPHDFLGRVYARMGRHEDAAKEFRRVVELKPILFWPEKLLARELAILGRRAEAIAVLQAGLTSQPASSLFLLEAGKIYREAGQPEEAAQAFQKVTTLYPSVPQGWEGLAASRLDQGRFADARRAIESRLKLPANDADRRMQQRQLDLCQAMLAIDARLPAILAGRERPAGASTLRALAEWCLKYRRLPATATGFYAAAFAAEPSLADDLEAANRPDAACAAALSGCGVGADAAELSAEKRAALRKQALGWLTADYDAWAERYRRGKPGDRSLAATAVRSWARSEDAPGRVGFGERWGSRGLRPWQRNEELASVRDEPALATLPPDERGAWQALWARVEALAARDPAAILEQARAHVARQEWEKAARCYAEGMELELTDSGDVWFEYAAAQLLAGDRPGYRRSCAHMLARCQATGQVRTYIVARACTLAPDSTDNLTPVRLLSARELQLNEAAFWALTELGALNLRSHQPNDVVTFLDRSLAADGRPGRAVLNWLWLALAHQQLGNPTEARRWLAKAANWLDQQGGRMPVETPEMGSHRHNWLEAHVLRREAEALLGPP